MAKITRYANDPATGERIPITEMADRYDMNPNTVALRDTRGKTGWDLVAPVDDRRSRAAQAGADKRHAEMLHRRTPDYRRELARELLHDPITRALAQPLIRRA
jgi:hypothetical protein